MKRVKAPRRLRSSQTIMKTGLEFLRAGLLWTVCAWSALAQSPTAGRIAGTVKDERGALLVGAEVIVRSHTTAEERKVTTDNEGNYNVPILAPGTYSVRILANGFTPAVFDPVQVVITETTTVDANLSLGHADPVSIRVDALLQKDSAQLGHVVDSRT